MRRALIMWTAAVLRNGCALPRSQWIPSMAAWAGAATGSRADTSVCRGDATPLPSRGSVRMVPGTMGEIYREPQPRAPQEGDTQ